MLTFLVLGGLRIPVNTPDVSVHATTEEMPRKKVAEYGAQKSVGDNQAKRDSR